MSRIAIKCPGSPKFICSHYYIHVYILSLILHPIQTPCYCPILSYNYRDLYGNLGQSPKGFWSIVFDTLVLVSHYVAEKPDGCGH